VEFFDIFLLDNTSWIITLAHSESYCISENIDTILLCNQYNSILYSLLLIERRNNILEIPHNRDTNSTEIIGICMCSLHIVTSCASLIYISLLPYDIIIPDITPSSGSCMIYIDSTEYGSIIGILLYILSSMMECYAIDRSCPCYWPYQFLSMLRSYLGRHLS
jgi:hypothetical protein